GDFRVLLGVRNKDRGSAGVVQDVAEMLRRERGVERYVHTPSEGTRQVRRGPLGPVRREDRHSVTGGQPKLAQPERRVLDPASQLLVSHIAPGAICLVTDR